MLLRRGLFLLLVLVLVLLLSLSFLFLFFFNLIVSFDTLAHTNSKMAAKVARANAREAMRSAPDPVAFEGKTFKDFTFVERLGKSLTSMVGYHGSNSAVYRAFLHAPSESIALKVNGYMYLKS